MTLQERIAQGARAMNLTLPARAEQRLAQYLELVEKWNRVHNLTSVRDAAQMVVVHALDSLSILPHLEGCSRILDVGTGAGLPGIPVAIAMPAAHVTLLDSSHKKCAFLEQARIELALANIDVVCERIEQWKPPQKFDAVVSRAFSELSDFVVQAQHAVAEGGRMIAMKGVYPFDEIARVPATHRVAQVLELHVPQLEAKRHLVFVEAA
jgi:16S rRNA (guanine527-N7)-methyltransferase